MHVSVSVVSAGLQSGGQGAEKVAVQLRKGSSAVGRAVASNEKTTQKQRCENRQKEQAARSNTKCVPNRESRGSQKEAVPRGRAGGANGEAGKGMAEESNSILSRTYDSEEDFNGHQGPVLRHRTPKTGDPVAGGARRTPRRRK